MHGPAYRKAVDENGARYICATGLDTEMLVNCIGKINVDKVIELGEYFKYRLENAQDIHVLTKEGMDLRGNMGGRKVRHSGIKATEKGYPVMLTGQTSWCPIEESIEGTLVFDGAVFPPDSLGILREKINCLKAKRIVVGNYFVVPTGYLYKAIVWHGNNRFQYLQSRVRDYHRRNKGWSHYSVWLLVQEKGSSFFWLFFPVRSSFVLVLGRYMNRVGVEDF